MQSENTAQLSGDTIVKPTYITPLRMVHIETTDKWKEYYQAMANVEDISPMERVGETLERLRGRGVKKCALADREISISAIDNVYPCQLPHAPEFFAGNIHKQTLKDIYYDSPALQNARAVNIDTIKTCPQCPIRLICAGGWRARDYYEAEA
ncbi:MAG: SPASM domain-containing protein [Helicobacteraceae bacterium]|nr:SPASM domain-containing protein [Helicobacteraceae bacterium]